MFQQGQKNTQWFQRCLPLNNGKRRARHKKMSHQAEMWINQVFRAKGPYGISLFLVELVEVLMCTVLGKLYFFSVRTDVFSWQARVT